MGFIAVYNEIDGSIGYNQTGYEVSAYLPAAFYFNLTFVSPSGSEASFCTYHPQAEPGTMSPSLAFTAGGGSPIVQIYDAVLGWRDFMVMSSFLTRFPTPGPTTPFGSYAQHFVSAAHPIRSDNPAAFRIKGPTNSGVPTVTFTRMAVRLGDQCHAPVEVEEPPPVPEAPQITHQGFAEGSIIVSPSSFSPLIASRRNRVQLIS